MIPTQVHHLPVHPLAVHAAVVLVPLAALLAVLFVIPRTRRWAALPMPLVSIAALVAVWVARESGFNLKHHFAAFSGSAAQFATTSLGRAIQNHQNEANVLCYIMIPFVAIAVVVYLMWLRPSWWPSGLRFVGAARYTACAVLVIAAIGVSFQTYRVGEAGSKAVYNPDGTVNFNSVGAVNARR